MGNLHEFEPEYEQANERFHVVMDQDYRFLDNNPGIDRWVTSKLAFEDLGGCPKR